MKVVSTELGGREPRRLWPPAAAVLLLAALGAGAAAQTPPERPRRAATFAEYHGRVALAVAALEELAGQYARARESVQEEVWSEGGGSSD
ncbi:MAG TPA: hypothetical protein VF771_03780, partial [Longimicrobiaceae bacterium]